MGWEFKKKPNPNAKPKAGRGGWMDAKQAARNAAARRDEAAAKAARRRRGR